MSIILSAHARNHLFTLAEVLNSDGVDFNIISPYPSWLVKRYGYKIDVDKVKTLSLPLLVGLSRRYINSDYLSNIGAKLTDKGVARIVRQSPPRIVHAMNGSAIQSFRVARGLGVTTVLERSCPHISFQRELLEEEADLIGRQRVFYSKSQMEYWDRMEEEYSFSDYICVPSRYTAESFIKKGYEESKIKIVPLIAEKKTHYSKRSKEKGDTFKVLSVGGNFLRKGFFYLLQAWDALKLNEAELIIKGPVPEEILSRFNKRQNITIVKDYLSVAHLNELYNSADVFCLPSIDEGFGMVVLEAMNTGLVPIVTRNVGSADLLRNQFDSMIINIRSSNEIANAIHALYEDRRKLMIMSENARRTAALYEKEQYKKNMLALYSSITEEVN